MNKWPENWFREWMRTGDQEVQDFVLKTSGEDEFRISRPKGRLKDSLLISLNRL